jgi:hypothetical protein
MKEWEPNDKQKNQGEKKTLINSRVKLEKKRKKKKKKQTFHKINQVKNLKLKERGSNMKPK